MGQRRVPGGRRPRRADAPAGDRGLPGRQRAAVAGRAGAPPSASCAGAGLRRRSRRPSIRGRGRSCRGSTARRQRGRSRATGSTRPSASATFLAALHRPAPDDAPPNPYRGVPLSDRADRLVRTASTRSAVTVDRARIEERWAVGRSDAGVGGAEALAPRGPAPPQHRGARGPAGGGRRLRRHDGG